MKNAVAALGLLVCLSAPAAGTEQVLHRLVWSRLTETHRLKGGTVLPPDGNTPFERLLVENTGSEAKTIAVTTINDPGVTMKAYAMRGEVAYEAVEGDGYLETCNHFPGHGAHLSRTLDAKGLLRKLTGTSDWREFLLPFYLTTEAPDPVRIDFNVVLPGRGRVYLRSVRLTQYGVGEVQWTPPPKSSARAAREGWIAAVLLGLLAAATGALVALRKARKLVMALTKVTILAGVFAAIAGLGAIVRSKPPVLCYPLLISGVISALLFGVLFGAIRRRYEQNPNRSQM